MMPHGRRSPFHRLEPSRPFDSCDPVTTARGSSGTVRLARQTKHEDNMQSQDVAQQIDDQIAFLHRCRSVFPRLGPHLVGQKRFETAPYYQQQGLQVDIELSTPATADFIEDFNNLAHWLNENFVLRLFAVLDSHQMFKNLSTCRHLEGYEDMDILRRLRNKVGHGSGKYDPGDPDKKAIHDRIMQRFNVDSGAYL